MLRPIALFSLLVLAFGSSAVGAGSRHGSSAGVPAGATTSSAPDFASGVASGLQTLEQRMDELHDHELRFAVQKSFTERHPSHKFGSAPAAVRLDHRFQGKRRSRRLRRNVKLSLFGQPLTLASGRRNRLLVPPEARRCRRWPAVDQARSWRPGRTVYRQRAHNTSAEVRDQTQYRGADACRTSLYGYQQVLAGAREVRELGPGTVDDQPVTSFLATLNPSQLEPSASSRVRRRAPQKQPLPHLPQPTATLKCRSPQNGLPVRSLLTRAYLAKIRSPRLWKYRR